MANGSRIRTVVVEDEEKILRSICDRIEGLDDSFEIVGTAGNGKEAVKIVEKVRPQVIFTDISMPVMGGIELIRAIRQMMPSVIIVIISGYSNFSYAQEAIRYGVFNYLLKPLESEELLETLFDIRQNLPEQNHTRKRHIVYSDNYELISGASEPKVICSLCVGNIIYNIQEDEVNSFYFRRMERLSWKEIMHDICGIYQWMVIDEHAVNQKIIEIRTGKMKKEQIREILQALQDRVGQETGLCVSICAGEQTVCREEQPDYVKRIRNIMRQRVVVGESRLLWLEKEEQMKSDVVDIVKMKLNQYVRNYFIDGEFDKLLRELETIIKYMRSNHAPQSGVEKICVYVLRLMEFSKQGYEKELLEELTESMMNSISLSVTEKSLFENLIEQFRTISNNPDEPDEAGAGKKVLDYVNEHYLTIESMEEVADAFGYNYAYLSRVFKKKVGESMNRYVTKKKIALAKELIETKQDMRLGEVCEMCGYNDSRYFSRVFKKETGLSPSEYKERKTRIQAG